MKPHIALLGCIAVLPLIGAGCVERILTVQTDPPGALVQLNNSEWGRTPVSGDFTWYGTYDVMIRHDDYQTIRTKAKVIAPLYEWIPLDIVSELLPIPIKDHHYLHYTLTPKPADSEAPPGIMERAQQEKALMETTHFPATQKSK